MLDDLQKPGIATRPAVAPEGLAAALLLAILATSGLYYLIILPVFVAELQTLFHLSPAQSGSVTSVNAYAGVLSALLISFFIRKIRWKPVLAAALLFIALCEAATPLAFDLTSLVGIRALHGLASGTATALTASVLGRTRLPDRSYGVLLIYQAVISAAALFVLPGWLATYGSALMFYIVAAATALAVAILPLLPAYPMPKRRLADSVAVKGRRADVIAAVAAVYVFQAFHTCFNGFTLGIGDAFGLDKIAAASGVGVGQTVGVAGAFVVIAIGLRFGRVRPLLVIAPVALIEGLLLLTAGDRIEIWTTAQVLDGALTYYALPLLLGTCAATEPGGRAAIWGSLGSKIGLATGPAMGGLAIALLGYRDLVAISAAGMTISGLLAIYAARRLATRANLPTA